MYACIVFLRKKNRECDAEKKLGQDRAFFNICYWLNWICVCGFIDTHVIVI